MRLERNRRRREDWRRLALQGLGIALLSLLTGFLAALAVHWPAPPIATPPPTAAIDQTEGGAAGPSSDIMSRARIGSIHPPPEAVPAAWLRPMRAAPGALVIVGLIPSQGEIRGATLAAFGRRFAMSRLEGAFVGLLPVPADTSPGATSVAVQWRGSRGGAGQVDLELDVAEAGFAESHITLTQEKLELRRDSNKIAADQERVNRARSRSAPRLLGNGEFQPPIDGRRTTPFGFTRYVNGEFQGRHSGLDLAAPTGTPVTAPTPGIVVLAEPLHLTGNTVILDHGGGLFTSYCHLNSLAVAPGEHVAAGRIVGTVGETGVATGPHLHWSAVCGGVYFDPAVLLDLSDNDWNNLPPIR